jgi:transposase-like protein
MIPQDQTRATAYDPGLFFFFKVCFRVGRKREYPWAVRCLARDIDRLLVHYSFPVKHRITIRTTNPIERLFREVRRRTRPIGSFTNTKSLDRIAYGIFWIINRMWEDTCLPDFTRNS